MNFFYILNHTLGFIVYVHTTKNDLLLQQIKYYIQDKKNNTKLYLIYSSDEGEFYFENEHINFYFTNLNFEQALLRHNYTKDRLASKLHNKLKFIDLYDKVSLPLEQIQQKLINIGREVNNNIKRAIDITKEETYKDYNLLPVDDFSLNINDFISFIKSILDSSLSFNFKSFFEIYSIPIHFRLRDKVFYKTILFENIYYRNKGFYQKDGSFFNITCLNTDIEYSDYNKIQLKINKCNAIEVDEPVLFLDYIYDFYNFGEFWDITKRLIFFDKQEHVELYGLSKNKIQNIENYFSKFNINYPPKYSRDYKTFDEQSETNIGSTYLFKKLYVSTINNTCRSALDPWVLFEMNKYFNPNKLNEKNYILYLSRGKESRGMINEENLLRGLNIFSNFKVLNGNESFNEQQYYFTNAKLIIGVHGALQGNFVWNKNNFIFVELAPYQRCRQLSHFGDAYECGFKSIIIPCDADIEESIIMSKEHIEHVVDIVKTLVQ